MKTPVVITGLGTISALGHSVDQFWEALCNGESGIRELASLPLESLRVKIGAEVPAYEACDFFSSDEMRLMDRFSQFAVISAREAVADAGITAEELRDAACIIGTGCGGRVADDESFQRLYLQGKSRGHPLTVPLVMANAAASQVSMHLGITGPVFVIASACASSAHAVGQAMAMIRSGLVDVAIAGGTDAPFTYGTLKPWEALRVMSSDTCRPFSRDRSGMVLGEGAGAVVLESLEHVKKRGACIYAELAGCGMSADAGHITDPSSDGAAKAIKAALDDASMNPGDVDYVNAHGTGTKANDVSETQALHQVFGEHAARLMVSGTKSMHGHPLGAAGALELVATVLAIKSGIVPPTANFTAAGEGCDLDYVPNQAREKSIKSAVSNSFAFGGLNAVLAVRAMDSV